VGDDVYGEDPTVNRLEEVAAETAGKEAALFVVSGTMGNLVSILTHCGRGDEVIMGDQAHTFIYEAGGVSALGGVHVHTVQNGADGSLDPRQVEHAIRADNIHFPVTRLICLENTHNRCGGAVLSVDQMASVREVALRHGVPVHLDGASIFNAAVALGLPMRDLAAQADSIQFCLSKGLAAPVGSLIASSATFIARARRMRKMQMVDRLADDHANARRLAEGLAEIPGVAIDPSTVQTNIVIFGLSNPAIAITDVVKGLAGEGVKMNPISATQFRAVTHYGIERDDIDAALIAFRKVMGALG